MNCLNLNSENKVISVTKFLGQKCVVQTGSESKIGPQCILGKANIRNVDAES